jgi:hypothetical protein
MKLGGKECYEPDELPTALSRDFIIQRYCKKKHQKNLIILLDYWWFVGLQVYRNNKQIHKKQYIFAS